MSDVVSIHSRPPVLPTLIAGAFLAARILVRAALGEPDKTDEIFAFMR